jgi:hypothetical protein
MTATYRSRNRVMGLASLASDDDGAVDLGSTRRPRAKAVKNLAVGQLQFRQLKDGHDEAYPFNAIQRL